MLFDRLDARQTVELFVTINAKHTRLNPSHIVSLAGRKLYPDPNQALAHDVIRSLNEDDTSPLAGEMKMLGHGRGRVSQAPLAEEMVEFFETVRRLAARRGRTSCDNAKSFSPELHEGGGGRLPHSVGAAEYSIKTGSALRALGGRPMSWRGRGSSSATRTITMRFARPWLLGRASKDRRFETEGEWKSKLQAGTRRTVEALRRELRGRLEVAATLACPGGRIGGSPRGPGEVGHRMGKDFFASRELSRHRVGFLFADERGASAAMMERRPLAGSDSSEPTIW